jgi:predicted unusual protein kinase regulating ubiquinone biosynthesis (AarF/ABC1/UbiB family)
MEWIDGAKINDLHKMKDWGVSPTNVAQKMAQIFGKMIFL